MFRIVTTTQRGAFGRIQRAVTVERDGVTVYRAKDFTAAKAFINGATS